MTADVESVPLWILIVMTFMALALLMAVGYAIGTGEFFK